MVNDMFLMTRWRNYTAAYGHAMLCAPFSLMHAINCGGAIVPTGLNAQGIRVPISRGGPPAISR